MAHQVFDRRATKIVRNVTLPKRAILGSTILIALAGACSDSTKTHIWQPSDTTHGPRSIGPVEKRAARTLSLAERSDGKVANTYSEAVECSASIASVKKIVSKSLLGESTQAAAFAQAVDFYHKRAVDLSAGGGKTKAEVEADIRDAEADASDDTVRAASTALSCVRSIQAEMTDAKEPLPKTGG